MNHAIRIHQTGAPDVLRWESVPLPAPGPGEVQVRHTAIGVNYIDVYHRSGVYPFALPGTPGLEGAGVVTAVGDGVAGFAPGDRIAYAGGPPGGYAEARNLPATRALPLPAGLDEHVVASMLFSGLTAQFLARRVYPIQRGDTILVHAAAGGVGQLLCQWARAIGATVIGTVGSAAKAEVARERGCDHVILYRETDFAAEVLRLTEGRKVAAVYDSVGRDTLAGSIDCLRPLGTLVSFGVASGEAPPLDLRELMAKGSLYVTRPSFAHYMGDTGRYREGAAELFARLADGSLRTGEAASWPLERAADAHRALESRATTGASLLIPASPSAA